MYLADYNRLFKDIIRRRHGREIDFAQIESKLDHLRKKGEALKYKDLLTIGNDKFWPFSEYWMWPAENQISPRLSKLTGRLSQLPNKEEFIIGELDGVLKNISLVSIILRFVHPQHYAIYSRPPLWALRIERGRNDVEEYLNYIRVMRTLMRSYGVERTADVDTIVWATAKLKGKLQKGLTQMLAFNLPECLTPGEVLEFYAHDPLKIANLYFVKRDHKTAGYWTAIAFERILDAECPPHIGLRTLDQKGQIKAKVDWLCSYGGLESEFSLLNGLRLLRNKAIHPRNSFSPEEAQIFINDTQKLAAKMASISHDFKSVYA